MVYFLIPIFNEADNLDLLAQNLKNALPAEEKFYVFSDDGSVDDSVRRLVMLFKGFPHVILGDGKNYGPGNAFNIGFEWILSHTSSNYDLVVTMEADNTSDINILPQMIGISRLGFDLVLASIYVQGGGLEKAPFIRKILSLSVNMVFRTIFEIKVLTLSSFYRVYKICLLKEIKNVNESLIVELGFISMLEILIKSIRAKASIIEVPMRMDSTIRKGKSKMKVFKTAMSYFYFLYTKGKLKEKKKEKKQIFDIISKEDAVNKPKSKEYIG